MVSAQGIGWPSQRFQNRDAPDISSALRLLIRAKKQDHGGFGYRGRRDARLWSVVCDGANQQGERWNTLSANAIRRPSKSALPLIEPFPFQFGNFLNEAVH